MKNAKITLSLVMIALLFAAGCAGGNGAGTGAADGEQLVSSLWDMLKDSDTAALDDFMADSFQSVHENGANDKAAEMELIAGLDINDYDLSDTKITRNGDTIIATYIVSVEETIDGQRLSKEPAARMSVFVKTADGWKWQAHVNLRALAK